MRILIVDECVDLVGGVERTINTLANELIKNNEVEILSRNKLKDCSFYKYNSKIKKYYLYGETYNKSLKCNKNSLKYFYYKIIEKINKRINKKKTIKNFFEQHKNYDVIVFGRVFIALDFLPIIKENIKNCKIIVRDAIHLHYFDNKTKNKLKKYFPSLVNTFIVSSDESIKDYNKFFGKNNINIIKVYNPIGINYKKGYNFNSNEVISIGRMDDNQKGFDNLIKSFVVVHKSHPTWKLKLYGDGNIKNDLLELIDNLDANEYIKILPTTKDVVKIFNNSSIFVLSSRYEGYANILVEALSCGIPSISYNWYSGVEEIISHNNNGLVVELQDRFKYFNGYGFEKDIDELAKSIIYLIEHPDICKKFSKNSIKIIDERSINVIIEKWKKIINS